MRRRSFLALCGLSGAAAVPAIPAVAEPPPAATGQRWFIQVSLDGAFPVQIDPADYPGRVEITIGGEFVTCAWAPVYENRRKETFLVPLSLGTMATGRREDIKVEFYGELNRAVKPIVKITAVIA